MPLLALQHLCCPIDGEAMQRSDQQWRCPRGHSFDIARQGYINLLPVQHKKSKDPGDSKAMVNARKQFLDRGIYRPIADAITQLLLDEFGEAASCSVLDAGCGDGYYLNTLAQALVDRGGNVTAIGLDISKWALRCCLQRNRSLNGIVASNRSVPLPTSSQDIVLCAFGFPVYNEFSRLLRDGGYYLQVDSGPDHLLELREKLYAELRRSEPPSLDKAEQLIGPLHRRVRVHQQTRALSRSELDELLSMTPHNYRAPHEARQALLSSAPISLTLDVELRLLRCHGAVGEDQGNE
ncbi:putative RNA methyltransferase [Spongiibacter sp. UBA1325]|uniref:putative RNA methyltransferase n=1 Tax=Spongiibacter sp. UBA1325 TaxID=1947543 RepID=UPI002580ADCE|nr:methyltransferase domain-containing protein [Spongiibacter sp. UBA1325]